MKKYYRIYIKRLLDVTISMLVLLCTSPVFILTFIVLLLQNKGKVFFFQLRPGRFHKPFTIFKFKTMNDKKDASGYLLSDVKRLTFIGRWIRKLSLDELPQLINVIKGDMSLIGPRPLLFKYQQLYSKEQDKRHSVRPGITGWAQVNGRNTISWSEKFELDVYYVNHLNFKLDFKIFWLTISKVVKSDGINQSVERPMMPFDGTN